MNMIAYARIHSAALNRIRGIFHDVDLMVIRSKVTRRVELTDKILGPYVRSTVFDRLLVIRSEDVETIEERCDDLKIEGLQWRRVNGPMKYGNDYAYRSKGGDILFRIGALRNQRRFTPTANSEEAP